MTMQVSCVFQIRLSTILSEIRRLVDQGTTGELVSANDMEASPRNPLQFQGYLHPIANLVMATAPSSLMVVVSTSGEPLVIAPAPLPPRARAFNQSQMFYTVSKRHYI